MYIVDTCTCNVCSFYALIHPYNDFFPIYMYSGLVLQSNQQRLQGLSSKLINASKAVPSQTSVLSLIAKQGLITVFNKNQKQKQKNNRTILNCGLSIFQTSWYQTINKQKKCGNCFQNK